jgi:hypothetical protein
MSWFYADDNDNQHEVAEAELPGLITAGTIRRDTLIWNETMADWEKAQSVRADWFEGPDVPPELTNFQKKQIVAAGRAGPGGIPASKPADALAVCAMVFGVLGIICIQIFSPVAVICGHIALKRANENGDRSANKGLAIAGLVTGYLGLMILIVIIAIYGFAFAAALLEETQG